MIDTKITLNSISKDIKIGFKRLNKRIDKLISMIDKKQK